MATLEIKQAGPLCTLQDNGRRGLMRFGVNSAGVMDRFAAAACWQLLQQAPDETPLLEITLGGITIAVDQPTSVAVISSGFTVKLDGKTLDACVRLDLQPGQTLQLRAGPKGQYAYLGLAADWALQPLLGSWSTHLRSGLFAAPALAAGDRFDISPRPLLGPRDDLPPLPLDATTLRCIPGPQEDRFTDESIERFYTQTWTISPASDRMASTLNGEPLQHKDSPDIVSDGIAVGSIQVPGSGQPMVLMPDCGSTGGYPKIAAVISADLPLLAQARPGTVLSFSRCTPSQASTARSERQAQLQDWLTPRYVDLSSERLLALNLVDGIVDAHKPAGPQ